MAEDCFGPNFQLKYLISLHVLFSRQDNDIMYSLDQILNNPLLFLQDVIGDAKLWPQYIRRLFWNKSFTNVERL